MDFVESKQSMVLDLHISLMRQPIGNKRKNYLKFLFKVKIINKLCPKNTDTHLKKQKKKFRFK